MYKYYRLVVVAFIFSVIFIALSTSRVRAVDTRCSGEIWDIMKTQAEASVLASAALAAELVKQSDSVLAMTCFDQAMRATAKSGSIFSDVPLPAGFSPTSLGTMVGGFVGGLAADKVLGSGVNAGVRTDVSGNAGTLLGDLNNTISSTVSDLLDDYVDAVAQSITVSLQSTITNFAGPILGSVAAGLLSDFFPALDFTFDCPNLVDAWRNDASMAVIANGLASTVPFVTKDELLDYAQFSTPIAGLSDAFDNKISSSIPMLQKAYDDLNNKLAPGGISVYKNFPAIGRNSSLADVTGAM